MNRMILEIVSIQIVIAEVEISVVQ